MKNRKMFSIFAD